MSQKNLSSNLSNGQLKHLVASLRRYRDDELPTKVTRFLNLLSADGIDVARGRVAESRYADYIIFIGEVTGGKKNPIKVGLVAGQNAAPFIRSYFSSSFKDKEAEVNPMLMLEYGSGQWAAPGWRGTFPGQQLAHLDFWYWYEYPSETTDPESTLLAEFDDKLQMRGSEGEVPLEPMHTAALQMKADIERIAKMVFG